MERIIIKYSEEDNLKQFQEKYGNLIIKKIESKRINKDTIRTIVTIKEQKVEFNNNEF